VRWVSRRLRLNEDRAAAVLRHVGMRVEDLVSDRVLLRKVVQWSALQWCFDMAALWVFIRAFGASVDLDALVVAFGLANILAAIPITPGGLGIVEATYISTLVGFGIPRRIATLGTASYRMAQFFFPILLGGLMYLSLRVGPWSIERRDRLLRLRELAEAEATENRVDFILRFGRTGFEDAGVVDPYRPPDDGATSPPTGPSSADGDGDHPDR
jgi:putative heme transporter